MPAPLLPVVFLDLSVLLDLGLMYATDRRQTKASLNAPAYLERGHNKLLTIGNNLP